MSTGMRINLTMTEESTIITEILVCDFVHEIRIMRFDEKGECDDTTNDGYNPLFIEASV